MEAFREPINSKTLQEKFPEVYREFFQRNEIIISNSAEIALLHDNSTRFRGVSIKQKIPLRIYCGINFSKAKEKNYVYYDPLVQNFSTESIEHHFPDFYLGVEKIIQNLGVVSDRPFSIEILSEVPKGLGFSITSKIGINIVLLLMTYFEKINIQITETQNKLDITEESQKKIIEMAYEFLFLLRKKNVDISSMCSSFSNSILPDYCVIPSPIHDLAEFDLSPNLTKIQYGNFQNIFAIKDNKRFYDSYFLYFGKENPIISYPDLHKRDAVTIDTPIIDLGKLMKTTSMAVTKSIYLDYLRLLYNLSFSIFYSFGTFLEDPLSTTKLAHFMALHGEYATIKKYIESEQAETLLFMEELDTALHIQKICNYSIIRIGSFKTGGGITIFSEEQSYRSAIEQTLLQMKESHTSMRVSYVSYIDGAGSEGVKIEKSNKQNVWSSYDKGNQMIVEDWGGNISYPSSINPEEMEYDLILDMVQNKILIQKEYITSKELHSQRMTLDVLNILLMKLDQEVPNTELPASSYSQNKNEMQGKIIIPLSKLILEKTGKKILLTCKGSNTKYYLKLSRNDLTLAYIHSR